MHITVGNGGQGGQSPPPTHQGIGADTLFRPPPYTRHTLRYKRHRFILLLPFVSIQLRSWCFC